MSKNVPGTEILFRKLPNKTVVLVCCGCGGYRETVSYQELFYIAAFGNKSEDGYCFECSSVEDTGRIPKILSPTIEEDVVIIGEETTICLQLKPAPLWDRLSISTKNHKLLQLDEKMVLAGLGQRGK